MRIKGGKTIDELVHDIQYGTLELDELPLGVRSQVAQKLRPVEPEAEELEAAEPAEDTQITVDVDGDGKPDMVVKPIKKKKTLSKKKPLSKKGKAK